MRETELEPKNLPELSTEILLAVMRLRTSSDIGDFDTFHASIQKLFQSFEKRCKDRGIDVDDVSTAKYALAAFLDETVLNSRWPYKDRWADNPLQLDYFGTYLAGEIFYDKVEDLRARAESKADLLEVYYMCLLLGFRGKYGVSGQEKLRSLIENIAAELNRVKPAVSRDLSPHWKIPDGPQVQQSDKLPRWAVLTCWIVLAVAVLLYFVLFFKVRSDADSLREKVRSQAVSVVLRHDKAA